MELAEPVDTIMRITVWREIYRAITIAYNRWRGRVIVCRIVIGYIDVWWIVHFTSHNRRLRDALPMDVFLVVTCHMRILKYDING